MVVPTGGTSERGQLTLAIEPQESRLVDRLPDLEDLLVRR